MQWTFHIITFGCKVNQYESHAIAEAWCALGGRQTHALAKADVLVINSCAVTAKGERDARNACYRLHREAPHARHILTGCAASLVNPPTACCVVPARAKALLLQGPWAIPQDMPNAVPPFGVHGFCINSYARARAVVKVQDGCSHRCTYCIVPLMRGPSISRPPQEVLAEVTALITGGFGEIILSGINVSQYGQGTDFGDFWDLVRLLDTALAPRFAGSVRVRLSSLDPAQLDTRGLDTLMAGKLLCPHVHLALQHGSVSILRRMGRGHYHPQNVIDAVAALRRHWSSLGGVGLDILMGFPGEGEQDVRDTLESIAELRPTYAHVFPYSARPDTAARDFAAPVPQSVKLHRAQSVRRAVEAHQQAFLHSLCNLPTLTIVADNACRGVSEHYAPCCLIDMDTTPPSRSLVRVQPVDVVDSAIRVRLI